MGIADSNQYSTVRSLYGTNRTPSWVSEVDRDRLLAYQKYDQIYWSDTQAFQLARRGSEIRQIYIPDGKTIVNETAHYFLKGLEIVSATGKDSSPVQSALKTFFLNTSFMSRFMIAKKAGVAWGDWVFHITADPDEAEGYRVTITAIDPSVYFPEYDDDDDQKVNRVVLATLQPDDDGKDRIHRLTYWYEKVDGQRRVAREELSVEADEHWLDDEKMKVHHTIREEELLPEGIQRIPVYHFRNQDWMGQPFGSSELRGYERVLASINQTVSDEELGLALEGLGVYATDAGSPVDAAGNATDWEVSPGRVVEVPAGAYFKRVEGIQAVTPMLDHVKYLEEKLWESSGTFRAGQVDVQVAQSGIALQVRFLPTLAKLEDRDLAALDLLHLMFLDWTFWWEEFEDVSFSSKESAREIECKVGEKLPIDRDKRVMELNNMLDRHVIDRQYYRDEMTKLGYTFPDDIESRIEEERENDQEFTLGSEEEPRETITEQAGGDPGSAGPLGPDGKPLTGGNPNQPDAPTVPRGSTSNNRNGRVNESNGTETGQTTRRQQRQFSVRRSS